MPETPETHNRITRIQKDIEELRQDQEDSWHLEREKYEKMLRNTLQGNPKATILYLEIDGLRSIMEIDNDLKNRGQRIARMTLWRAEQSLLKGGLVRKVGVKGKSPIYAKKRWAIILHMDDYVRTEIAT